MTVPGVRTAGVPGVGLIPGAAVGTGACVGFGMASGVGLNKGSWATARAAAAAIVPRRREAFDFTAYLHSGRDGFRPTLRGGHPFVRHFLTATPRSSARAFASAAPAA